MFQYLFFPTLETLQKLCQALFYKLSLFQHNSVNRINMASNFVLGLVPMVPLSPQRRCDVNIMEIEDQLHIRENVRSSKHLSCIYHLAQQRCGLAKFGGVRHMLNCRMKCCRYWQVLEVRGVSIKQYCPNTTRGHQPPSSPRWAVLTKTRILILPSPSVSVQSRPVIFDILPSSLCI